MTALPSNIGFGLVVGQWLRAVANPPTDPQRNPDAVPAQGTVLFTASPAYLVDAAATRVHCPKVADASQPASTSVVTSVGAPHWRRPAVRTVIRSLTVRSDAPQERNHVVNSSGQASGSGTSRSIAAGVSSVVIGVRKDLVMGMTFLVEVVP